MQSDQHMLENAIEDMQGQKMQLILYDASGNERRMIVSCSPTSNAWIIVGCLVTLHPSEAITLQDAFANCSHARALVSAEAPNAIHMIDDSFLSHFARSRSEVLGQPLHFIDSSPGASALAGSRLSTPLSRAA